MGEKQIKQISLAIFFALIIALGWHIYNNTSVELNNVAGVVAYLRSFGFLAPTISIALLIIQAFFPVVPFFLLASANGILYSFTGGFLITWLGALAGASISFFVARSLGRQWVLNKCQAAFCKEIAVLSGRKGFGLVFLARIVPIIPSTLVNLLAGVSTILFSTFLAASALGKMPAIIFYTLAGDKITVAARYPKLTAIIVITAVAAYLYFKFNPGRVKT